MAASSPCERAGCGTLVDVNDTVTIRLRNDNLMYVLCGPCEAELKDAIDNFLATTLTEAVARENRD